MAITATVLSLWSGAQAAADERAAAPAFVIDPGLENLFLGLTDAYRAFHSEPHRFSWWDYRGGSWPRDQGLRIDHLLLSPQAADRLVTADIDRGPRGKEKASDHTPVWCALAD